MRVVSWFSCGAASATATLLALHKYPDLEIVYCKVNDEHLDNARFLKDFERVIGKQIKVLTNDGFNGSVQRVILKRGYIKNKNGAPCTAVLKKDVRREYQRPGDLQIFGFTAEETERAGKFIDANNDVDEWFPLIDYGFTKAMCLDVIQMLGIDIPVMYRLGYKNNNCIGCVKGGMGYWNQIRIDFPDRFEQMAKLERIIGFAVNKDDNGPVFLDELDPNRGHRLRDAPGDCGFTCEASK